MGALVTCLIPDRFALRAGEQGGMFGWLGDSGRRIIEVTGETRGVLAARLSPVPADPVSYGAGFARVSPRSFAVGTFIGEIPWVAVEVTAGASLRSLTLTGLTIDALPHVLRSPRRWPCWCLRGRPIATSALRTRRELEPRAAALALGHRHRPAVGVATSATIARPNPVPASLVV